MKRNNSSKSKMPFQSFEDHWLDETDISEKDFGLEPEMMALLDAIEKAQYELQNGLKDQSFRSLVLKNYPMLKVS